MENNKKESYCSSCKGCSRMENDNFKLQYFYCIDYDPNPQNNLISVDELLKKWEGEAND